MTDVPERTLSERIAREHKQPAVDHFDGPVEFPCGPIPGTGTTERFYVISEAERQEVAALEQENAKLRECLTDFYRAENEAYRALADEGE